MMDNLLNNALKYTPKGGRIHVSAQNATDQIIFQVTDNGPGIPPSEQPYVFDKFFRATNIDDVPGTGLGLAIVKSIVENHQGQVWVDSIPDEGSTFTVVLPVAEERPEELNESESE
jgi:two-component system NtrC family sensor kinase